MSRPASVLVAVLVAVIVLAAFCAEALLLGGLA